MPPRIFVDHGVSADTVVTLPESASQHVKVLRLQPGAALVLFDGSDGAEWPAEITSIGRSAVEVRVGAARWVDRELAASVTIAIGMPANDRMDGLIEKACELGAAAIQPLLCDRSVLRVSGERAAAKQRHWQGIAVAASEQCGRARVAQVGPVRTLQAWLAGLDDGDVGATAHSRRIVLSFAAEALPLAAALPDAEASTRRSIVVLSGPEGGLTSDEEAAAAARRFLRASLGPRVLRADTAPLAVLAWLGLNATP